MSLHRGHLSGRASLVRFASHVVLIVCLATIVQGCERAGASASGATSTPGTTLKVGLYPYVPRPKQVQSAIASAWRELQPEVALDFSEAWDGGYSKDPAELGLDVFVFDAIYLMDYVDGGELAPIAASSVSDPSDFLSYALSGVRRDSSSYWGLPMYGCAAILFYRAGDTPLEDATTATEVDDAIRDCSYTSKLPPDKRGLMIDMAGGTTSACQYVDAVTSIDGKWPVPLPKDPAMLNATAIGRLRELIADSSYYNATSDDFPPYGRAGAFGQQGVGRAVVGFTESMSAMGDARKEVRFKVMPMGDDPSARPLFYGDVIGVRPGPHVALGTQLADVMASSKVMVAAMEAGGGEPAQYLMPTRESIFDALGSTDPIYVRMKAMVAEADPRLFALSKGGREWVSRMKGFIQTDVRESYPCGCDQDAPVYLDQASADASCPGICAGFDGDVPEAVDLKG